MNNIVIIMGLPGSGKSFLASQFAKKRSAVYISSDQTRIQMRTRGKYNMEDKLKVYQRMAEFAGQGIQEGKDVVVDGTFHRKEMRHPFEKLAKRYGIRLHFVEMVAPEITIQERLSSPRRKSDADFGVYQIIKKEFEPLDINHLVLNSGKLMPGDGIKAIENYILRANKNPMLTEK